MSDLSKYFFKLVCVNENNPLEYEVLEDVNLPNLDFVHAYVENHIEAQKTPEMGKWLLLPMVRMK